jgi:hypothetical protein
MRCARLDAAMQNRIHGTARKLDSIFESNGRSIRLMQLMQFAPSFLSNFVH